MSGGTGKDANYWPGFVDALTNVVIAMVFVIVVLAIALSFSAQLLAQRMSAKIAELQSAGEGKTPARPDSPPASESKSGADAGPQSARTDSRVPGAVVIDVHGNEKNTTSTGGKIKATPRFLSLNYEPTALTLDEPAAALLVSSLAEVKKQLSQLPPGSVVRLVAKGPAMELTESRRAAYIRVMAVRNVLIEQGITSERIVSQIDTETRTSRATVSIAVEPAP